MGVRLQAVDPALIVELEGAGRDDEGVVGPAGDHQEVVGVELHDVEEVAEPGVIRLEGLVIVFDRVEGRVLGLGPLAVDEDVKLRPGRRKSDDPAVGLDASRSQAEAT